MARRKTGIETAMETAVERRDRRLLAAAERFGREGGAEERAVAIVRAAYGAARRPDVDHGGSTQQVQTLFVDARPPRGDQSERARPSHATLVAAPSASTADDQPSLSQQDREVRISTQQPADGGDQIRVASKSRTSGRVASLRAPTPGKPRALADVQRTQRALSAFDSIKLPDRTPIGEIYFSQLPGLITRNMLHASFLTRLLRYGAPPADKKIREWIPEKVVQESYLAAQKVDIKAAIGEGILLEPDGSLSLIKRSA